MWLLAVGVALFAAPCRGFYVPGVAPIDFEKEDSVEIKAVKMTSSKTQLPYEYYSLPMCKPDTVGRYLTQKRGVKLYLNILQLILLVIF